MMSYVLARGGQPPFVMSVENAVSYFDVSAAIRDTSKRSPGLFLRDLGPRQRLAELLAAQADPRYLLP